MFSGFLRENGNDTSEDKKEIHNRKCVGRMHCYPISKIGKELKTKIPRQLAGVG